ncbi:VWA domain-containing protein [Kocuria palustris]|uniref:vWA domain-containing protein n=1 Tax=Kocuria palustris TaxID=71999 RepID=UPI0019D260A5|nr:VWA domain-containing protein [Kocuria palustris]MBN6752997.1 VWA domain-containing protein [Kocuria palustris]MBN6757992.1 VWA domain-containing protein [Kocuria palustris]MBN6763020.1 VWA domain-containing protein [Kocuria palustris]MBN6782439.1 VWA domain-containing protein [Kocuria palustris]MBN6800001.1 VWA domain-containing protein [Kocuria palustris]
MPAYRNSRYGRYRGGPDPLAPPPDLTEALDAIGRDVMEGYSPQDALREFLRRGGRGQRGLDDLSRRVNQRRRELLGKHSLGGTLDEVKSLLEQAVRLEREQLLRDARMDPTDRQLREMQLGALPSSTAAAVSELADYDWASQQARQTYEQIKDKLGREVLDQRFAGMKQALEGATEEDRQAISQMLADLNELLAKHARGEDTPEDFEQFMEEHGEHFPEDPQDIDELIDAMAQRSAAAARMMNSMTPEQRQELMELSAQAFGSPQLMEQLSQLDANLQALRPGEDWSGSERFEGQEGLGLGDGTGVLQDIADLDALADQLSQSHQGAALDDIDLDALGRQLGQDAAVDARTLSELEKALRDSGLLHRGSDGALRLSPRAVRQLGRALLRDTAEQLSGRPGSRDTRRTGASGELTGSTRAWQFGDLESWDVTRTITNAIQRTVGEGGDPSRGMRLRVEDVEVQETEDRTQAAVALLVDTSFSMAAEGRWLPMKQTALALHHLISTRFRGDSLELISFGRWARTLDENELTAMPPVHEQGTNLHHGLLLAGRFFRRHPSMQPILLIVTDGEPTAHLLPSGDAHFDWPTSTPTLQATVSELDRVTRTGAHTTFFQLGDDPGLSRFLNAMARRADGRVVAVDPEELGSAVLDEYLSSKGGE